MTRAQLRRIFRKHYGSAAQVARELGLHRTTIYRWLGGHVISARIETAMLARARELASINRVPSGRTSTSLDTDAA